MLRVLWLTIITAIIGVAFFMFYVEPKFVRVTDNVNNRLEQLNTQNKEIKQDNEAFRKDNTDTNKVIKQVRQDNREIRQDNTDLRNKLERRE